MVKASRNTSCLWCGKPVIPQEGRGRPRKYCRPSCRQRAYESRRYRISEIWDQLERTYDRCYLCGVELDWEDPAGICLDHKISTVYGGRTDVDNLRPVHLSCNNRKSDRLISEPFNRAS